VEQLLKLFPQSASSSSHCTTGTGNKFNSEIDEEIDVNFAGNAIIVSSAIYHKHDWILDIGATDHIAMDIFLFKEVRRPSAAAYVSLPNAQTAEIIGLGDIELASGMLLKNVLCVQKFKYNLLSISRLAKDSHVIVVFHDTFCFIQDCVTHLVKEIGKEVRGLDYLLNLSYSEIKPYVAQLVGNTGHPNHGFRIVLTHQQER